MISITKCSFAQTMKIHTHTWCFYSRIKKLQASWRFEMRLNNSTEMLDVDTVLFQRHVPPETYLYKT